MRGKHADELAAHFEREQVDFYDKPMARAREEDYELDRYDDTSRKDFEREMQKQGFPIRGPERGREREIEWEW